MHFKGRKDVGLLVEIGTNNGIFMKLVVELGTLLG